MRKFFVIILGLFLSWSSISVIAAQKAQFIALSDIHFNPFADCKAKRSCALAKRLRQADSSQWGGLFDEHSSKKLSKRGQDTNYALLQKTLRRLRKQHANFAIILGDFLPHHFAEQYRRYSGDTKGTYFQEFANKTLQFLARELYLALGDKPIYAVMGNNDSVGGEGCSRPDYCIENSSPFLQSVTADWREFLINADNQQSFTTSFPVAGYYKVQLPGSSGNDLIVLNTVLFSIKAQGEDVKSAAQSELDWLQQQLEQADDNSNEVIIVGHIPPIANAYESAKLNGAVPFWQPQYAQQFFKLLEKYHNDISGLITSHTHMDAFALLPDNIIDTFVPSISPVIGNNPAYKVYQYQPSNLRLLDYQTYYLNLAHKRPKWRKEYDFNKTYQPDCDKCALLRGMRRLSKNDKAVLTKKFIQYFVASSDVKQPIAEGQWDPYYWCATQQALLAEYKKCLG